MARYRILKSPDAVAVEVTAVGSDQEQLISALQGCAEGNCSCPSDEYKKVATIRVTQSSDRVDINLETKPGTDIDPNEVARCLDHTLGAEGPATSAKRLERQGRPARPASGRTMQQHPPESLSRRSM